MEYMLMPLKKFADFNGRARRKEYWMFILFFNIISIPVKKLDELFFSTSEGGDNVLESILIITFFIPILAVIIRRMHDVGKSGWYFLIPIYNLILALTEGEKGFNKYGPDPKNPTNELESLGKDDFV
ncbi:MAG: DUF805 domain-containing protein [Saprospiraceae bacterium]|jgi:uncharacterized membrane protein YhaH (DUF805 family)|nr:DUF805 domain-containing protein [Saprospiraceae bacterium]